MHLFPTAKRPYRRKKDAKPSTEGEGENTAVSAGESKFKGPHDSTLLSHG